MSFHQILKAHRKKSENNPKLVNYPVSVPTMIKKGIGPMNSKRFEIYQMEKKYCLKRNCSLTDSMSKCLRCKEEQHASFCEKGTSILLNTN